MNKLSKTLQLQQLIIGHVFLFVFIKRILEQSLDSGTGTMATVSTGAGRFSRTSPNSNSRQINVANVTSGTSSVDHLLDILPKPSFQHPPSPPVRQRARYGIVVLLAHMQLVYKYY